MSRTARFWSLAVIVLAGFTAGTVLHPMALPAGWTPRALLTPRLPADPAAVADRAFRRCDGLGPSDKRACYERDLVPLARARGPKEALDLLTRITMLDEQVRLDAHDFAHAIGVAAFDAHPDVERTFPDCSVDFQSGCYHGVIQAFFMRRGSDDSAAVRAVCAPFMEAGVYGWLRFQCAHGLGHGLTMLLDHDLPDALGKCDFLEDAWDRDSCYGGAFMENVVDTTQPKHEMGLSHGHAMRDGMRPKFKQLDRADPTYPCSILADRYQTTCWENQASVIEYIADYDVARSAAGCDRAPARYVRWCYIGIGTDINGRTVSDPQQGLALCDRTGERWREWCYVGVAKNLVEVGAQPHAGMAFCAIVTRTGWRMRCYEAVGEEIASVSAVPAERERYCEEADAAFRPACRFGARLQATRPPGLPSVD
jgi:hypothetical protein